MTKIDTHSFKHILEFWKGKYGRVGSFLLIHLKQVSKVFDFLDQNVFHLILRMLLFFACSTWRLKGKFTNPARCSRSGTFNPKEGAVESLLILCF